MSKQSNKITIKHLYDKTLYGNFYRGSEDALYDELMELRQRIINAVDDRTIEFESAIIGNGFVINFELDNGQVYALECHQRKRENTSLDVPNEVSGTFQI